MRNTKRPDELGLLRLLDLIFIPTSFNRLRIRENEFGMLENPKKAYVDALAAESVRLAVYGVLAAAIAYFKLKN